jgi:hypothetical protein
LKALAPTEYVPFAVPLGEVTLSVAAPLVPGVNITKLELYAELQLEGTAEVKSNTVELHPALSLSETLTVKFAVAPGATEPAGPVTETDGLAGVQAGPESVTSTVAPAPLTAVGEIVIPAAASV